MKEKILIIVNPISGGKRKDSLILSIHKKFKAQHLNFKVCECQYAGHTEEIIAENLLDYYLFIAVGGDGTVHEVAQKLVNTDKALAILPCGSGNGLANSLGFSKKIDDLLIKISKKNIFEMDVLKIQKKYCLNISGIGLDGEISYLFSKSKRRGLRGYISAFLSCYFSQENISLKVKMDDNSILNMEGLLFCIANGKEYGNNLQIAPRAKLDDGLINLIVIKKVSFFRLIIKVFGVWLGRIRESKYYQEFEIRKLQIQSSDSHRMHIDGEPYDVNFPLDIEVVNKALKVLQ